MHVIACSAGVFGDIGENIVNIHIGLWQRLERQRNIFSFDKICDCSGARRHHGFALSFGMTYCQLDYTLIFLDLALSAIRSRFEVRHDGALHQGVCPVFRLESIDRTKNATIPPIFIF